MADIPDRPTREQVESSLRWADVNGSVGTRHLAAWLLAAEVRALRTEAGSLSPRSGRGQVDGALELVDLGHTVARDDDAVIRLDTARVLAAEVRALRAEVERVHSALRHETDAHVAERDRLRAALVARTPQPAEPDRGEARRAPVECPGCGAEVWPWHGLGVHLRADVADPDGEVCPVDPARDAPPAESVRVNRSVWVDADTWRDPDCIECGGEGAPCCDPPDAPLPAVPDGEDARRLRWEIFHEDGVGVIVTDLDTERWATGTAATEHGARKVALRNLAEHPSGGKRDPRWADDLNPPPRWREMVADWRTVETLVGTTATVPEATVAAVRALVQRERLEGEDVPARLDAAADALEARHSHGLGYELRQVADQLRDGDGGTPELRAAVAAALALPTEREK